MEENLTTITMYELKVFSSKSYNLVTPTTGGRIMYERSFNVTTLKTKQTLKKVLNRISLNSANPDQTRPEL